MEEETTPPQPLATIPSPGGRIHVEFGLGNELFVVAVSDSKNSPGETPGSTTTTLPCSTAVAWGRMGPVQRRIAYDTCAKYVEYACGKNVQEARRKRSKAAGAGVRERQGVGNNDLECVFAQAVSEILGNAVGADGADGMDGMDGMEGDVSDVLSVIEEKALWELICSFVFADDGVGVDLGGWYYGNATSMCGNGGDLSSSHPFSLARQAYFQSLDVPELDGGYWSTFLRLIAIGWVSDALDLLAMHSGWLQWDSDADARRPKDVIVLENMSLLLRRFPGMRGQVHSENQQRQFDDVEELMAARKSWLAQVEALKGDAELWTACGARAPETMRACLTCLDVLLGDWGRGGDDGTVKGTVANCCELLIAKMTHVHPDARGLSELRQLLGSCVEALPPENEFQEAVAMVIEQCCQTDHQAVIRACSFVVSDWFLAHVPIVLKAHPCGAGGLDRVMEHLGSDQCEFYRLDYACSLASSPLTWHMAARYMGFCEHHGRAAFEEMMRRLPLGVDGRLARQAVNMAQEYGMDHLCAEIQRQQGAVCRQGGLPGVAAQWFSTAGDFASADECLAEISRGCTGAELSADAIDDLKECVDAVADSDPGPNTPITRHRALLLARIAAHRSDFSMATSMLRRVERPLGLECMVHLTESIPDIKAGALEKEDLILLLDLVNNVTDEAAGVLEARRSLLRLLAV